MANPTTSALFATILVEYLLDRLPEMGSNVELSNLYLKLFKLVFGSVSLFAAENEQMLKVKAGGEIGGMSTKHIFRAWFVERIQHAVDSIPSIL